MGPVADTGLQHSRRPLLLPPGACEQDAPGGDAILAGRKRQPERAESSESDSWQTEADASLEHSWPNVDRRRNEDRRDQPTGFLSRPWRGRRRAGRRAGERDNIYVDVYSRSDVLILLCIFILNIGDAAFTLLWLQRGGGEGNPVMQFMLDIGVGAFLFQKCIVVGIWLLILTAHRNYRSARAGLWSTLSAYTLLIVYHLVLVGFDVDPVIVEIEDSRVSSNGVMADLPVSGESPEQDGQGGLDAQDAFAQSD